MQAAVRRDTIVGLSFLQPSSMLSLQNTSNVEEERRANFEQSLMTMLEDAGKYLKKYPMVFTLVILVLHVLVVSVRKDFNMGFVPKVLFS